MEGIEHGAGGSTFTGDGMALLRLTTMLRGMTLEIRTGMKLCRGPTCYTRVKRELGFKGNREKVLAQLLAHVRDVLQKGNASAKDIDALLSVGSMG